MFRQYQFDISDEADKSWRAVAAAWLVPILFATVFVAADAIAARHHAPARECATAGAMIPRHDPSLPGPDEIAASDWLERVRAEGYSGL